MQSHIIILDILSDLFGYYSLVNFILDLSQIFFLFYVDTHSIEMEQEIPAAADSGTEEEEDIVDDVSVHEEERDIVEDVSVHESK